MATRSPGPSVKPSTLGRVFYGITGFFVVPALMAWDGIKLAAHWVWRAPVVVKVVLGLILLGSTAGGAYVLILRQGGRTQLAVNDEWKKFETAARSANEEDLQAALDGVLRLDPTNADALRRKTAIETGEADPADKPMIALTIRIHLKHNRHPEAVREAKKMLAHEPRDWISNCILGQDAILRKDQKEIDAYLAVVSDPNKATTPDLGGLLYALELHRQAGKDASVLRTFTVNRVIPNLKNANLSTIPAAGRIQILACYIDTCLSVPDATVQNLLEYWTWASGLADGILDDARAKNDALSLTQLGTLHPPLAGAVGRFVRLEVMKEAEAKRQSQEIEARARKVWAAIRVTDPKNPAGYDGEAYALLRVGDVPGALKMIEAGRTACEGWNMPLLTALTAWAKAAKKSEEVLPQLLDAANKYPDVTSLWQLVAELAEDSHRRDIAIDAIRRARDKVPNNPTLVWAEARLLLDADKPNEALELLGRIPERVRLTNPVVARAYVRALVGAGQERRVPEIALVVLTAAEKANDVALALAPVLALLDGPPTLDRMTLADEFADKAYIRWSTSVDVIRARATARVRAAEEDPARWPEVRVIAALDALERLKTRDPTDLWAAAMTGWVRIKGNLRPESAWDDLRAVEKADADPNANLPADVLESLGVGYLYRKQYDDAIRVLTRAADKSRQPASPLLALCLAHSRKGDTGKAREVFRHVGSMSQSDRVRDEYKKIAPLFTER